MSSKTQSRKIFASHRNVTQALIWFAGIHIFRVCQHTVSEYCFYKIITAWNEIKWRHFYQYSMKYQSQFKYPPPGHVIVTLLVHDFSFSLSKSNITDPFGSSRAIDCDSDEGDKLSGTRSFLRNLLGTSRSVHPDCILATSLHRSSQCLWWCHPGQTRSRCHQLRTHTHTH